MIFKEILFIPIMIVFLIGFIITGIYSTIFKNENILSNYIDGSLEFVENHNALCILLNTLIWIIIIQILL